jgi:hypothetical protein
MLIFSNVSLYIKNSFLKLIQLGFYKSTKFKILIPVVVFPSTQIHFSIFLYFLIPVNNPLLLGILSLPYVNI